MIFRKPYAFLIKHFKLIHLIVAALSIYITYKLYKIVDFFNDYIGNGYTGNTYTGFSENFIPSFLYITIIACLIGLIAILILFLYKKRPPKTYFLAIVYFICLIILLVVVKNTMLTMETAVITSERARNIRDLSVITFGIHIIFNIIFLLRGIGLIGKYNFREELKDLDITEADSEEIEITFHNDNTKIKRLIRRYIREFKYYIKENLLMFILSCIFGVIVISLIVFKTIPESHDRKFNQQDVFAINDVTYSVKDSIITNLDYAGNTLDSYYLVVQLSVLNSSLNDTSIDLKNFRLEVDNNLIYPVTDKGAKFIDYGKSYNGSTILNGGGGVYSLVFKIDKDQIKKRYRIKANNGSRLTDNVLKASFNYINITPIVIDTVTKASPIDIKSILNFSNSNLGNSYFKVSNPNITTRYLYTYEYCQSNGTCSNKNNVVNIDYTKNNRMLIVLDYEFALDKTVPYYSDTFNVHKFISNFVKVKYTIGSLEKYESIEDITPNDLNNKIVIQTNSEINKADELYLVVTIRNKEFSIKIK